ncbi:ABCB family ABC transporter ATP-binding protein/permease [Swaminathania salitolerans]|uniref:Metal ABC transporter permease n=1 Tax=Swaminathania salitolerans TaxID=182838 RepID=A0A511BPK7_9PROT|nr:ABC transporter transmembrane domain-containing protein [Swaminathania salitolerans]GBQ10854.1 multidrug ABC transporter ATP-binding protein [Swaminathania salitolerans LMG 21291]GEL02195.1 metal ABC transporter permease [Swaminathania salitolerans]
MRLSPRFPLAISSLFRAWRLVLSHDIGFFRIGIAVTLAALVAERLCLLATPYLFGKLVGHFSDTDLRLVVPLGLILSYGGLILLRSLFSALQERAYQPVGQRVQALTAQSAFRHLLALPLRFHRDRQTGALTRSIERGSEAADTLLRLAIFNIGPALLDTVFVTVVMSQLFGPRYACVILAALGAYMLVAQWFVRRRVGARRRRNEANGQAQHFLLDSLLNFETVRHFANEAHEFARYARARREQERASLKMTTVAGLSSVSQNAMIALATVILFLMAARDLAAGRVDVAAFVMIGTYLRTLYMSIVSLNLVYAGWRNACVDLEHLLTLMDEPVRKETGEASRAEPETARGMAVPATQAAAPASLVFENVRFGYDAREILAGISLHAEPGQMIALVGPTGAGKSTIARLILGAYPPSGGRIFLDGQDITGIPPQILHDTVGVVPQETQLFNDTIGYNIAYGRLDATEEDIVEAARAAQLHDFVEALPEGYDTRVGERGLKLSGGERQRIAIARIVLRKPRLLLLDEATSALDTRTERRLIRALATVAARQTTIAIAHRLSTIRHASCILVIEGGRIRERGTHDALMRQKGVYHAMWSNQSTHDTGFPAGAALREEAPQPDAKESTHDQIR